MTLLSISIIDDSTGSKLPCKVRLLNSFEEFLSPLDSIKKIGPGLEFFYSDGDFTMDMPSGKAKILIERGTEYEPLYLEPGACAVSEININLFFFANLNNSS